jgi:hypothetical protein
MTRDSGRGVAMSSNSYKSAEPPPQPNLSLNAPLTLRRGDDAPNGESRDDARGAGSGAMTSAARRAPRGERRAAREP